MSEKSDIPASPEVWELANAAIAEARRIPKIRLRPLDKYANLLKGIVVCPRCKALLFSRASGKDHPGGKLYRYYSCAGSRLPADGEPCNLRNVAAQPLEDAVTGFLCRANLVEVTSEAQDQVSAADRDQRRQQAHELAAIEADLAKVQSRLQNCLGILAEEGLEALKPELTEQLKGLQSQKQTHLVRKEICRQRLAAFDELAFNRTRISHAFDRLARPPSESGTGTTAAIALRNSGVD